MISQHDLARRFAEGSDDVDSLPAASNVEAESPEGSDGTELREFGDQAGLVDGYLVGYNWAIYAARLVGGTLVVFPDWRDHSQSTSCQISAIERGFKAEVGYDSVIAADGDPQMRTKAHAESNQSRSMHARR